MNKTARITFLVITMIVFMACKGNDDVTNEDHVTSTQENASKDNPETENEISKFTWDEIDTIYNRESTSTELQKEEKWKNYVGKTIRWKGAVVEVSGDDSSGVSLDIKMNRDTEDFDLRVDLMESEKEKAAEIAKGDAIGFTGVLTSWGVESPIIAVEEGNIVEHTVSKNADWKTAKEETKRNDAKIKELEGKLSRLKGDFIAKQQLIDNEFTRKIAKVGLGSSGSVTQQVKDLETEVELGEQKYKKKVLNQRKYDKQRAAFERELANLRSIVE